MFVGAMTIQLLGRWMLGISFRFFILFLFYFGFDVEVVVDSRVITRLVTFLEFQKYRPTLNVPLSA